MDIPTPIAVLDVHYAGSTARASCVVAATWSSATAIEERTANLSSVLPYRPGAFFERELPCLLQVLGLVTTPLGAIVIDGYVELDALGAPGLGAHLFEALGGATPVVGIAKTSFRGSSFATDVLRGTSRSPLFVTSRGIARDEAARVVRAMHGPNRLPTLVVRADHLARRLATAASKLPAGPGSKP